MKLTILPLLALAQQNLGQTTNVVPTGVTYQTTTIFLEKNFNWANIQQDIAQALAWGYNRINVGFYMSKYGCQGACMAWRDLPQSTKQAIKNQLLAYNATIYLSVGGPGEYIEGIIDEGDNGLTLGVQASTFALQNDFDGLDFAVSLSGEGTTPSNYINDGSFVGFAKNLANAGNLNGFPRERMSVTSHAPYFSGQFCNGTVTKSLASLALTSNSAQTWAVQDVHLDMFNENNLYQTYDYIFENQPTFICSVKQVAAQGIPLENVHPMKPVDKTETTVRSGFVDLTSLQSFGCQANSNFGWNGGYTGWTWNSYDDGSVQNFGTLLSGC